MSVLWTAKEAAAATDGEARGDWTASGVSIDTRTLERGDLFIALRGMRDGHEFVADALKKGAGVAMVAHIPSGVAADTPLLVVKDTQAGLEALGRASRARTEARIIAVTGSVGKTTTKEMLRLILARAGTVSASAASYNNHWGVPLSLARMGRDISFGVFEIGMNHAGEIRVLVRQVRPHAAVITTIAPAHLEYFGTIEAIADTKAEIFEGLEPGGTAILPADNPQIERLKRRAAEAGIANIVVFGSTNDCDAQVISARPHGNGQIIVAEIAGNRIEFEIGAAGMHVAENSVIALLAASAVGADPAQGAAALRDFTPLRGRGVRSALGDIVIIDESYNANPASMAAALKLLRQAAPQNAGRRIAVLGDMLELGVQGPALHAGLARDIAMSGADLIFLCGPQMHALWEELPVSHRGAYAQTSSVLAPELTIRVRPGDVVLVKGSLGSRMSVIIDALNAHAAVTA